MRCNAIVRKLYKDFQENVIKYIKIIQWNILRKPNRIFH